MKSSRRPAMVESRPNPLGVKQFEVIEFASPEPEHLHKLFRSLGFTPVARHKRQPVTLYRQGGIDFLVNETPDSFASDFAREHGPCCVGFGIRVDEPVYAYERIMGNGGKKVRGKSDTLPLDCPCISGIGGSVLYLTGGRDDIEKHFEFDPSVERTPPGAGLTYIDHLTHNVYDGNMGQWAAFYENLFGFFEVKYFDIKGQQTGLRSKAMTAPNGAISIPINESEDPKSQINEYLSEYNGEGVQHIALYTDSIYDTVGAARQRHRVPGYAEHLLRRRRPAHPRTRRERRAHAQEQDPDRRRPERNEQAVAAALHPDQHRPDLLRDHPAQGQRGLRRRQLPGLVRSNRTRSGKTRGALIVAGRSSTRCSFAARCELPAGRVAVLSF